MNFDSEISQGVEKCVKEKLRLINVNQSEISDNLTFYEDYFDSLGHKKTETKP